MKFYPTLIFAACIALSASILSSCNSDDDEPKDDEDYTQWALDNQTWLEKQLNRLDANGQPYYRKIVPTWNSSAYILVHQFNDPAETADNLVPLYTSTVDVCYRVLLYDGTAVDSSYNITGPVKGALRTQLSDEGLIAGWKIALTHMHVGDTCEVVIPYNQGYGALGMGSIKPYSNLQFNLRLVDIPYYEVRP